MSSCLGKEDEIFQLITEADSVTTSGELNTVYVHGNSESLMSLVKVNGAVQDTIANELGEKSEEIVAPEAIENEGFLVGPVAGAGCWGRLG